MQENLQGFRNVEKKLFEVKIEFEVRSYTVEIEKYQIISL